MSVRTAFEVRGEAVVARVTIDNPRKLNVLDRGALVQLGAALRDIEAQEALRAVVLTGAGEKAFAGGAHLDDLASLDPASAREYITLVHEACAAMRDCPVPVIARINGHCIGAGLELAAACDLRIASQTASFAMPEVRLGLPSVVEAALLPRLIGAGRARWLVMTGEGIGAEQALAWGLVERLAPPRELDAAVDDALRAIVAAGPHAMRAQKTLCKLWEEAPLDAAVRASIDAFARSYESAEPARRIAAFRAQRERPK
jgi:enoyl-CoA hydratase